MTNISAIRKLAEEKADLQERRGTSAWSGFYYGFIIGFQEAERLSELKDS